MSFQTVIAAIIEFVRAHADFAPPIALALSFWACCTFTFLLGPATAVLFAMGGMMGAGNISFWPVWIASGAGSSLGYLVSYAVGVRFKERVQTLWPLRTRPELYARGKAFFDRWGGAGVFIGHNVPMAGPIRGTTPLIAGTCDMKFLPFLVATIAGSFLWAANVLLSSGLSVRWLMGWLGGS